MTRIKLPSDIPLERSQNGKLPARPGFYRQDDEPELVWFSWFRPAWPPIRRADGSFTNPIGNMQVLWETIDVWPIAHQGIKVLGAHEPQNAGYRLALVVDCIASLEEKESLLKTHRSEAKVRLLDELEKWGRQLRDNIAALPQHVTIADGKDVSIKAHEELTESPDFFGGPLRVFSKEADREYISLLEKIGPKGKEIAAKLRKALPLSEEEADNWTPWLPPPEGGYPVRHAWLLKALWEDRVRPRLEKAARKHPALARLVHSPVTALLSAPKVREEGGQMALDLGLNWPCVIRAELAASPHVIRGIGLFQSIHAHSVIRGLAFAAHERALSGELDPRVLTYEGGFAALAEAYGIEGREGATKARELLEAFAALDLSLPGGDSARGLLTFVYGEARRNRKAYLKVVAGLLLLPDYVHQLQRIAGTTSVAARRDQDLIPLLPVPPVLGRANDAGAQATLQLRVMAHLRDHAVDLAEGRGALLTLDTWAQLAAESHVPRSLVSRLLSHWQEDHQDGPAVLKRVDRDRYTLGDAHAAARAFLEDGGRRSLDSSEAGRRSAAKRAAARSKVGQK